MCTSRLPEALWPTERLARLSTATCSFRGVSEATSHSAGSIACRASLVLHVLRSSPCTTTAPSKQHGLVVQLDTLLTVYRYLSRP